MNPLSSRRYTELVDRLGHTVTLLNRYLELKIQKLEKEMKECSK